MATQGNHREQKQGKVVDKGQSCSDYFQVLHEWSPVDTLLLSAQQFHLLAIKYIYYICSFPLLNLLHTSDLSGMKNWDPYNYQIDTTL